MAEQARNPHLMSPQAMKATNTTAGMGQTIELMSEILKNLDSNYKDKNDDGPPDDNC